MPKFISSLTREISTATENLDELKANYDKVVAENLALKAYIKRNSLEIPGEKSPQTVNKDTSNEKHYLSSTKASRNRSAKTSLEQTPVNQEMKFTTIGRERYTRKDGRWIKLYNNKGRAHFQEHTWSSYRKKNFGIVFRDYLRRRRNTSTETEVIEEEGDDWGQVIEEKDETDPAENETKTIQDEISEKTALNKRIPWELEDVPLESQIIYGILRRALSLTQKILFDGCTLYAPGAVANMTAPHEFRLGRVELKTGFLCYVESEGLKTADQVVPLDSLALSLGGITTLRNTVCHFGSKSGMDRLGTYDYMLCSVQNLAAIFGNEQAAFRARALRDTLVKHAQDGEKEIENLWLLYQLPGAYPWRKHHKVRFDDMRVSETAEKPEEEIGVIERSARDWAFFRFQCYQEDYRAWAQAWYRIHQYNIWH